MTTVPTGYQYADRRGVPAFEVLDSFTQQALLAGSEPGLSHTVRVLLASSLTLAALSVVGLDASNHLVLATYNADPAVAIKPIGVLVHAATSAGSNTTKHGEVWLTGNFNAGDDSPLVWDASFDTLAKKVGALTANPNLQFRTRRATGTPQI